MTNGPSLKISKLVSIFLSSFFFGLGLDEISMLMTQAICSKSVSVERSCLQWLCLHMLIEDALTLECGFMET